MTENVGSTKQKFAELKQWMEEGEPLYPFLHLNSTEHQLFLAPHLNPLSTCCLDCEPGQLGSLGDEQVVFSTGQLSYQEPLIILAGYVPIPLTLRYLSQDPYQGAIGAQWKLSFETQFIPFERNQDGQTLRGYYLAGVDGLRREFLWDNKTQTLYDNSTPAYQISWNEASEFSELVFLVTHPDGKRQYFKQGKITEEQDRNGNWIRYHYDEHRQLTEVDNNSGSGFLLKYENQQVVEIHDHDGRIWRLQYNDEKILENVLFPTGARRHYGYHKLNSGSQNIYLLSHVTDSTNRTLLTARYQSNHKVESVQNAEQALPVHYQYDDLTRLVQTAESVYQYDAQGIIVSIETAQGRLTQSWDAVNRVGQVLEDEKLVSKNTYDAQFRLIEQSTPQGKHRYKYNKKDWLPSQISSPQGITHKVYDSAGNCTTEIDSDGLRTERVFDKHGNVVELSTSSGEHCSYTYNNAGSCITQRENRQYVTQFEYDCYQRLIKLRDAKGQTLNYAYNDQDQLLQLDQRSYHYSVEGELEGINEKQGPSTRFVYDDHKRILASTNSFNQSKQFDYHPDNGQLRMITREDSSQIKFSFSSNSDGLLLLEKTQDAETSYQFDGNNRLLSAYIDESNLVRFDYDNQGNICDQWQQGEQIRSAYANNHMVNLRLRDHEVLKQRDKTGRLVHAYCDQSGSIKQTFQTDGQLTERLFPNGLVEKRHYAEDGSLLQIELGELNISYEYNALGLVTKREQQTFDYDDHDRLVRAGTVHYRYDDADNLVGYDHGDKGQAWQVDGLSNRLLETDSHVFQYDGRGNLTCKTVKSNGRKRCYFYNQKNQLIKTWLQLHNQSDQLDLISFSYDPLGRRIQKNSADEKVNYWYDRHNLIGMRIVRSGLIQPIDVYIDHADDTDSPLCIHTPNGTFFYHCDHQGSVIALSNHQGEIVERYDYDPWGNINWHKRKIETFNPFSFTGREQDLADLYFYRARYYDPTIGRFLSPDPIEYVSGQANLYSYTGGDPVNFIDPFGYKKKCMSPKVLNKFKKVGKKLAKKLGKSVAKRVATTAASLATGPGAILVAVANIGLSVWDLWSAKDDIIEAYDLIQEADLDFSAISMSDVMGNVMNGQPPLPACPPKKKPKPKAPKEKGGGSKGKDKKNKKCPHCPTAGMPVNPVLGNKILAGEEDLDFTIQAPMPLVWQRNYASDNPQSGLFGQGWRTHADCWLEKQTEDMCFFEPNGRDLHFSHLEIGESDNWPVEQLTLYRVSEHTYQITTQDNANLTFIAHPTLSNRYTLQRTEDANGNGLSYQYSEYQSGELMLQYVLTDDQRCFELHYMQIARQVRLSGISELVERGSPQAETAGRMHWVEYEYSDAGDLIQVKNHLGRVTREFAYQNHMMVMHRIPGAIESRYQYDELQPTGRVVRNELCTGEVWEFDYSTPNQTRVVDPLNRSTLYTYDDDKYLTGERDALGQWKRHELDNNGLPSVITDEAGNKTKFTFDNRGNTIEFKEADGNSLSLCFHDTLNVPIEITDSLGQCIQFEYDEKGNLLKQTDADGAITRFQYNSQGLPSVVTDALGGENHLAYDERGNLVSHTDCSGNSTSYVYDKHSQLVALADSQQHTTRYQYDDSFNLTAVVYPDGTREQFSYDELNRLQSYTDPAGNVTCYEVDKHSRPTVRTNALGHNLKYKYDRAGRLSQLINENGATYQFSYDPLDRLIQEQGLDGLLTRYQYDPTGNITEKVENANTQTIRKTLYLRDKGGRLIEKYISQGKKEARTRYQYDDVGQLIGARNQHSHVTLDYDAVGRLLGETTASQFGEHKLQHQYDLLGNRTASILPSGQTIKYLYYGSGHLLQINLDDEVVSEFIRDNLYQEVQRTQGKLSTQQHYDNLGRLTHQLTATEENLPNPIDPKKAYGLLSHPNQKDIILSRRYQYSPTGELTQIHDSKRGSTVYGYDKLGRILHTHTPNLEEHFAFDPAHNILPVTDSKKSFKAIHNNRLEVYEDKRYRYDDFGNLIEKKIGRHTAQIFEYDAEHQLIRTATDKRGVTQTTNYVYDPFGRRIGKKDQFNHTHFLWDGNRLFSETRGSRQKSYVYEQDSFVPVAQVLSHLEKDEEQRYVSPTASAKHQELLYYHVDHLGTPKELTNKEGHYIWAAEYKTWGNTVKIEYPEIDEKAKQGGNQGRTVSIQQYKSDYSQNLRFQGQYFDEETGLHYNRFRYYDPDIGRFISQDPIGLLGGDNLYQYADNPVIWTDAVGLSPCKQVNGNSASSTKAQHVYVIRDAATKKVLKVGISGGKIRQDGKSYRAESQVRKWDALTKGKRKHESEIIAKIPCGKGARAKALALEKTTANSLRKSGLLTAKIPGTNQLYHTRP